MGIHQRAFIHVSAYVDIHGRHADHARRYIRALAHRRASGNDTDIIALVPAAGREGVFIDKGQGGIGAHLYQLTQAKAEKNALLHPDVGMPVVAVFFCGADLSPRERRAKIQEQFTRRGVSLRLSP